jgi:hypothetical protein
MVVTRGRGSVRPLKRQISFRQINIMNIYIPEHIREALNKSPNASPNNSIIVSQLNEKLYAARWNLQHNVMELDQMWEVDYEIQFAK